MENLIAWVKGIAGYSILTAVLTELLPEKFHKYIRLYLGLLFILLFFSPFIHLFHLEERMEDFFYKENLKIELEDKSFELELKEQAAYEELKKEYTGQLTAELESFLAERGYELSAVELDWNQNMEEEGFGTVEAVTLCVVPIGGIASEIRINRVKVEVFQEQEENMEEKALKNELVNFYKLEESNINVSIQGGEGI